LLDAADYHKGRNDMSTGVGVEKKASDKLLELCNEVAVLERRAKINQECRCEELKANMVAHFGPQGKTRAGLFDPHGDFTSEVIGTIAQLLKPNAALTGGVLAVPVIHLPNDPVERTQKAKTGENE